ncbi:hypothetical protein Aduo_016036 [Ancylostoma duodenale]
MRRAQHLKYFKVSCLYVRPSLPKAEKDRQRAERAARRNEQSTSCQRSLSQFSTAQPLPNITVGSDATTRLSDTITNGPEPLAMSNKVALVGF